MSSPFVTAILLAAGRSTRMGLAERKPFLQLEGESVLALNLHAFARAGCVQEVIVVVSGDELERAQLEITETLARLDRPATWISSVIPGGNERTGSVRAGVNAAHEKSEILLIHDVARPFVRPRRIDEVATCASQQGAALLAVPVTDTIKVSDDGFRTHGTPDRTQLWSAQTPQGFRTQTFRDVLSQAAEHDVLATDDSALYEQFAGPVALVHGDRDNIKLTTPEDLTHGVAILQEHRRQQDIDSTKAQQS